MKAASVPPRRSRALVVETAAPAAAQSESLLSSLFRRQADERLIEQSQQVEETILREAA